MDEYQPKERDIHPDDPTLVFRKGRWTKRRKQSRYEEIDGQTHRLCTCCDKMLLIDMFDAHGTTHRSQCKVCKATKDKQYREQNQESLRERRKQNYQANQETRIEKTRKYRESHQEWSKEYQKRYYEQNKEDILDYHKKYYVENREKVIAYTDKNRKRINRVMAIRTKHRRQEDPHFRIACALRKRLHAYLKYYKANKTVPTFELLGCSIEQFVSHLEKRFQPGMTWNNYGKWRRGQPMKWVMDHIRPCASFDLTDPDQQKQCFHYTNIQPLWDLDNIIKSDKLDWKPTQNG